MMKAINIIYISRLPKTSYLIYYNIALCQVTIYIAIIFTVFFFYWPAIFNVRKNLLES